MTTLTYCLSIKWAITLKNLKVPGKQWSNRYSINATWLAFKLVCTHAHTCTCICVRERKRGRHRYIYPFTELCHIDITIQLLPYITFSKRVLFFITYLFDGLSEILILVFQLWWYTCQVVRKYQIQITVNFSVFTKSFLVLFESNNFADPL